MEFFGWEIRKRIEVVDGQRFLWREIRWAIENGLVVLRIPDTDCAVGGLFKHSTNASS